MPTPAGPAHGCQARPNGKSPHPDVRSRAISSNPDPLRRGPRSHQRPLPRDFSAMSGSGPKAPTPPTRAIVPPPVQSANTTASSWSTSTFCAAAHASHPRRIFAPPIATFSPPWPAGNSPESGWHATRISRPSHLAGVEDREISGVVLPQAKVGKPRTAQQVREFAGSVFVGILGVDALARNEYALTLADAHALQVTRFEMHFHTALDRLVKCDVSESRGRKVAIGEGVDVVEHVQIECRGNAARVVVRGVAARRVLFGIDPDQKTAVRTTQVAHPT